MRLDSRLFDTLLHELIGNLHAAGQRSPGNRLQRLDSPKDRRHCAEAYHSTGVPSSSFQQGLCALLYHLPSGFSIVSLPVNGADHWRASPRAFADSLRQRRSRQAQRRKPDRRAGGRRQRQHPHVPAA